MALHAASWHTLGDAADRTAIPVAGMVMRILCCLLACAALAAEDAADAWLDWFSGDLRALDQARIQAQRELSALGAPVVGQTVPQFGYQHPRVLTPPLTPPWVQVDLQSRRAIDWIVLVPAVLDWQSDRKPTYGFPPRFRIDISDHPDFATSTPISLASDREYSDPGVAPVALPVRGQQGRYVRVTVTELAREDGQFFYALAELMVIVGKRNVAVGRPVTASATLNIPPRWSLDNLVDGRTPLGPPISLSLLPWDGLFAGPAKDEPFTSMRLDLGKAYPLQEVRLHPVHARLGADIPGFSFPKRFRLEAAMQGDYSDAKVIMQTTADYPNPGDNPVTIDAEGVTARYLRIGLPPGDRTRFGLSEIEVYADDVNVARQATVSSTYDPSTYSNAWPRSLLVDGYTSYGKLKELPEWIEEWNRRSQLGSQLTRLAAERLPLAAAARHRAFALIWSGAGCCLVIAIAGAAVVRRRRLRELRVLRTRLARDLHDEIGSNLAAIAVISELAASPQPPVETPGQPAQPVQPPGEDWREVNRIAHESMEGMREVLWLVGAREEAGPDLVTLMRRVAERMLSGISVRWLEVPDAAVQWSASARREIFLIFKEALTNIVRHAHASTVEITLACSPSGCRLAIHDDGLGFALPSARQGIGLSSMRERARQLGAKLTIDSSPGHGTTLELAIASSKLAAPDAGSGPAAAL
jgi:signal transduction histidine kinase